MQKKLALAHFQTLKVKKLDFSINDPLVIVLGYILAGLAPGGAKNEVNTMYFGELLAKCRFRTDKKSLLVQNFRFLEKCHNMGTLPGITMITVGKLVCPFSVPYFFLALSMPYSTHIGMAIMMNYARL